MYFIGDSGYLTLYGDIFHWGDAFFLRSGISMRNLATAVDAGPGDANEVSILLVDDQASMRMGVRMLLQLEANARVVGEAGSAAEAVSLVRSLKPDLVIMDVEMPGSDGIVAAGRCIDQHPQCMVIILTIHNLPDVRARAMAAGAWAFVEKGKPQELRDVFRHASDVLQLGQSQS